MKLGWEKINIINDEGKQVEAQAPFIISASRSTDIPAFYANWFFKRLEKGYVRWINPFNRKSLYVSFKKTRLIVFWTKNAFPIIDKLNYLDEKGINYYFQFTINDYEKEKLEPNLPPLMQRIKTFQALSKKIGKEKVIWRFDPIILTNKIDINAILEKIRFIGEKIHNYTTKLVISFVDIEPYKKVQNNFKSAGIQYKTIYPIDMEKIAEGIMNLNEKWNLEVATCAENFDLKKYNIYPNRCIDDELMVRLFSHDSILMNFLGYEPGLFQSKHNVKLKDKGQRKACGCIISKDIGSYNTCGHLCVYCYANTSPQLVKKNLTLINSRAHFDTILPEAN